MPLGCRYTGEMASIDDFVNSPCDELLNSYRKDQLVKVAEHYGVEFPKKFNKDELLTTLKDQLVEREVLPVPVGSFKTPVDEYSVLDVDSTRVTEPVTFSKMAPVMTGLGFTLEQQKELIQQEHQNTLDLQKLKQDAHLREAELAHVQARQQLELERYKLELMSQGKLQTKPQMFGESELFVPPILSFDVAVNLRLVPKFNEKDPDIFFVLFERLAEARNWSDAERTLLLQCVLTGKAQEALSALTVLVLCHDPKLAVTFCSK